jgi:hypothetical protein
LCGGHGADEKDSDHGRREHLPWDVDALMKSQFPAVED